MPVLFPVSALLGSLGAFVLIVGRRFRIIQQTQHFQKELESHQKKVERAKRKQKTQKKKALSELKRLSDQKQTALRNLGSINELMKKADQDVVQGRDDEALKTLIQVLSLDDHHRMGNELLAGVYMRSENYKKAEILYKKLVELYPLAADYHALLGSTYLERRQFKAATTHYQQALQLDKNNYKRFVDLGQISHLRRDYHDALEMFEKAHRLQVRDIDLMFMIVDTCLQNSDPITAREYLHKILDYEPYNQEAKNLLSQVLKDLQQNAS